ncbi:hypothetical protein FD754_023682, partial [Muntiacus muntjak]
NILKTVALGQMLSLCICGAAIISQYLAERYKVNTLMLQSLINYCLLFLIYTVMLAFQSYILLGLVDAEANYVTGRAYQYRTLTSVQVAQVFALLDCFGIPVLMALSEFILYARYRVISFLAVAVGLLDIGTMVGADILAGREDNSDSFFPRSVCLNFMAAVTVSIVSPSICHEVMELDTGHLMRRADSLGKTLMLGKIEGGRRRGQQRMRCARLTWHWTKSFSSPPLLFSLLALLSPQLGVQKAQSAPIFPQNLSGFPLVNCAVFTPGTFLDSHSTRLGTSSLRLSIPGHYLAPEPHSSAITRSIFDPCLSS